MNRYGKTVQDRKFLGRKYTARSTNNIARRVNAIIAGVRNITTTTTETATVFGGKFSVINNVDIVRKSRSFPRKLPSADPFRMTFVPTTGVVRRTSASLRSCRGGRGNVKTKTSISPENVRKPGRMFFRSLIQFRWHPLSSRVFNYITVEPELIGAQNGIVT